MDYQLKMIEKELINARTLLLTGKHPRQASVDHIDWALIFLREYVEELIEE